MKITKAMRKEITILERILANKENKCINSAPNFGLMFEFNGSEIREGGGVIDGARTHDNWNHNPVL